MNNQAQAASVTRTLRLRVQRNAYAWLGDSHDRDVNAARNILARGKALPSVRGNESPQSARCRSRALSPARGRISAQQVAA